MRLEGFEHEIEATTSIQEPQEGDGQLQMRVTARSDAGEVLDCHRGQVFHEEEVF